MNWSIELTPKADRQLNRLDQQIVRRINRFIFQRIALLEDRAASAKRSRARSSRTLEVPSRRLPNHRQHRRQAVRILIVRVGNRRESIDKSGTRMSVTASPHLHHQAGERLLTPEQHLMGKPAGTCATSPALSSCLLPPRPTSRESLPALCWPRRHRAACHQRCVAVEHVENVAKFSCTSAAPSRLRKSSIAQCPGYSAASRWPRRPPAGPICAASWPAPKARQETSDRNALFFPSAMGP